MKGNVFARIMSMNDTAWQRHANPWSVWSRVVTGLPVILGAIWCIQLLGKMSVPILAVSFFWIWINPRLFSVPKHTTNWASKVTFGERVWINRSEIEIPEHHRIWALCLSVVTGIGFIVAAAGAYFHLLLPTLVAGSVSWFGKMWFCDRMVWLYEDMKHRNETYKHWEY